MFRADQWLNEGTDGLCQHCMVQARALRSQQKAVIFVPFQFSLFFTPQIRFNITFYIDSEPCSLDKNMRDSNKEEGGKKYTVFFLFLCLYSSDAKMFQSEIVLGCRQYRYNFNM